jgi:hypothetical protein
MTPRPYALLAVGATLLAGAVACRRQSEPAPLAQQTQSASPAASPPAVAPPAAPSASTAAKGFAHRRHEIRPGIHDVKEVHVEVGPKRLAFDLAHPERDFAALHGGEEVVLAEPRVVLVVDYPLDEPFDFPIDAPSARGFTRADLVRVVTQVYAFIYAEEERTSAVKTLPLDARGRVINRNQTHGEFGVCCHDLDDLVLHTLTIQKDAEGATYVDLGIDS